MVISKAQAEVLRRMRDGEVLEWHRGNVMEPEHSCWQGTYKRAHSLTVDALAARGSIRLRGKSALEQTRFWMVTPSGWQALKEYEAKERKRSE